jgi:hypothetical protein
MCQPSGSKMRRAMSGPPRQGRTGIVISSGMAESATACRESPRPLRAVLNTSATATPSIDDAAYDRSFTYCAREKSGVLLPALRAKRTGSISSSTATVHRSSVASG